MNLKQNVDIVFDLSAGADPGFLERSGGCFADFISFFSNIH